ncbi:GIY-YIG nuclease family protein [Acholeplasma hippikon]|uniref:Dam-replacing family n=1 Tax=Acholeplasma hippikon TaxID=264636 RepID=A0A449BK90_9MOLU|nr:GIY-YIG nuclease family protein [Acholeplasma hippikon]VEU82747.1 Dam-replacing family [Acholeplasma hippikon]
MTPKLSGWNYIVYTLISRNFKHRVFTLQEIYDFEAYFKTVYPENFHIKDKLRQILQNLRDKGLLNFLSGGKYQLIEKEINKKETIETKSEVVYLLSNESIPGWVKIGSSNDIERRLKELYNTSIPLPFKVEELITTKTLEESRVLEKSIHSIIDTINPNLRKNTEANKREFFKMTVDQGKSVFRLVSQIVGISVISATNPINQINIQ